MFDLEADYVASAEAPEAEAGVIAARKTDPFKKNHKRDVSH